MSSKVIFFIAFLAVVTGLYGVYDALTPVHQSEQAAPIQEQPLQYVTIWRSKDNLKKGQAIKADELVREQVLLDEAIKFGINSDIELDFAPTTLLNVDVPKGALVFSEYQTKKNQVGYLDLLVRNGKTLYPLHVSTRNLINGYIHPGDYIDILTISSPSENLSSQNNLVSSFDGLEARLFLSHLRVMNIGDESNDVVTAKAAMETDGMTTIIIEVDPDDIARLSLAQKTTQIEIYRSQHYRGALDAVVSDVINNYSGVVELRGSTNTSNFGGLD
ncbi:hypothetical protein ABT56_16280 [Photobacterium aquae]|uniref:Flp pilus assembly protein RcpC/CpaB domain-containing protein n=1 Tax=Photobacterium aquae TaxID=1195763 RepID=A0A0J1GWR6_9GAMM|nr:RcpC/CpaB family pilus assembly protein [Photobacterium aquae]KLV04163.1 hypothetical protein ABT56_16280 [Photobacterium aquae]